MTTFPRNYISVMVGNGGEGKMIQMQTMVEWKKVKQLKMAGKYVIKSGVRTQEIRNQSQREHRNRSEPGNQDNKNKQRKYKTNTHNGCIIQGGGVTEKKIKRPTD